MAHVKPKIGHAYGAALFGIEAVRVEVQAARASGTPRAAIIGQAETEVREARERLMVAMKSHRLLRSPADHAVIINLAPAGLRKTGTALDLPMCLAIAAIDRPKLQQGLDAVMAYAEVGLDGTLRASQGTLSAAIAARENGLRAILVAPQAAREAAQVDGIDVFAVHNLADAVLAVEGREDVLAAWPAVRAKAPRAHVDMSEVKGQRAAKRAVEVAAAGGHNLLLIGPPGSGKTLLARRMPTVLPPMTREEALAVTRVQSAAGLASAGAGLIEQRPFRAPHHSISAVGMVGGGPWPRPGEVSLAHHGVLFLDELPEFPRHVLETLRQPLEDGTVVVVRAAGRARFPARVQLVAAMNPCPCGWLGAKTRACRCSPGIVDRYRAKLSGPLLDRIDIHIEVPAMAASELTHLHPGEPSSQVRERVGQARRRQHDRADSLGVACNAHLPPKHLARACLLTDRARQALRTAMERLGLSARAHDRVLKVARTIADLGGHDVIDTPQIAEAVSYRSLDRQACFD